jgi:hypothetical protein
MDFVAEKSQVKCSIYDERGGLKLPDPPNKKKNPKKTHEESRPHIVSPMPTTWCHAVP